MPYVLFYLVLSVMSCCLHAEQAEQERLPETTNLVSPLQNGIQQEMTLSIPHFQTLSQRLRIKFFQQRVPKDMIHVQRFYEKNQYQPIWVDESRWCGRAIEARSLLASADEEGLDANDYSYALNPDETDDLRKEIFLTKAFLQYIDDMRNGRINPQMVNKDIAIRLEKIDPVSYLLKGVQEPTSAWMHGLAPPYAEYQALKALLKEYRSRQDFIVWKPLVLPQDTVIELGSSHNLLPHIRLVLEKLGYKSEGTQLKLYDQELEQQIRLFQRLHGLNVDGVIGRQTLQMLSLTPAERIKRIIITMEKWRWMPRNLGKRYVIVNIPSFELKAIEAGQVKLISRVIVGQQTRRTPLLYSTLRGVVLNPIWNVPTSIATKDILKKIQNDPAYLHQNNYTVLDRSGKVVSPPTIDWLSYSVSYFPYSLRQAPGGTNALGPVKFDMHNNLSIYLHSTPDKEFFDADTRTLSSGCIRVEKDAELAYFVLNNEKDWSLQKIEKYMDGKRTLYIRPSEEVPVYITYFTVNFDREGHLSFLPDVYGQDKQIEKFIFSKYNK